MHVCVFVHVCRRVCGSERKCIFDSIHMREDGKLRNETQGQGHTTNSERTRLPQPMVQVTVVYASTVHSPQYTRK